MQNLARTSRLLAASIIGGPWETGPLARRIAHAINLRGFSPERLALALVRRFGKGKTPALKDLASAIAANEHFAVCFESTGRPAWFRMGVEPPQMTRPPSNLVTFPLPVIETAKELSAWLNVDLSTLEWLADTRRRQKNAKDFRFVNYSYIWKKRPGKPPRLIESPKSKLKAIQRKILTEILNKIPPHEAAHGFCRNRSIITHALLHTEKDAVACFDLKDFFHSIPPARIMAMFRTIGYPQEVSRRLTNLCIHTPNPEFLGKTLETLPWAVRKKILIPHLPQGAPTSPALANLCAFNLDVRLQALAESMDLTYSRYADDLTFSGCNNLKKRFSFLRGTLKTIAEEEGFKINPVKTRLMTQAQRQVVTGVVVNKRPNISRAEYDRLKAVLHTCSKTREIDGLIKAQLRGKVEFVRALNPQRGEKLLALWEKLI